MPEPPRRLRFSALSGAAVFDEDGRLLGHLVDLTVERRGEAAVVSRLLVARPREPRLIRAVRGLSRPIEIEAARVCSLDECGFHIRGSGLST